MSETELIPTKGKPGWCAGVVRVDGKLMYSFPVASGHIDRSFSFEITNDHLQILQEDEERFYFLFAVMHETHQLPPYPTEKMREEIFDTILFANKATVSKFLTHQDARHLAHGGVSNIVRLTLGWEGNLPQPDNWFKS
ncbi:DUF6357 family protein [Yoonia sp. BS5-3]|uniref:DUF6357 family protein n=1 Tax=Yoonia phaeophyticola TaxID=3137369 RepID=A0ABZ2V0K7_9RHOB